MVKEIVYKVNELAFPVGCLVELHDTVLKKKPKYDAPLTIIWPSNGSFSPCINSRAQRNVFILVYK